MGKAMGKAMGKVTPVDGFMCSDGQFFFVQEEALAHQHALDLKDEIRAFIERGGAVCGTTTFTDTIAITLWEEHKKLKELQK